MIYDVKMNEEKLRKLFEENHQGMKSLNTHGMYSLLLLELIENNNDLTIDLILENKTKLEENFSLLYSDNNLLIGSELEKFEAKWLPRVIKNKGTDYPVFVYEDLEVQFYINYEDNKAPLVLDWAKDNSGFEIAWSEICDIYEFGNPYTEEIIRDVLSMYQSFKDGMSIGDTIEENRINWLEKQRRIYKHN